MTNQNSELQSAFDKFLAEVDTIKSEAITLFDHAPSCEWIVQVDPATQLPFYKHVPSGQTKTDMPEAYKQYLFAFDQFMQSKLPPLSDGPSEPTDSLEATNDAAGCVSTKRKHSSQDVTSPQKSSLHNLLGYSDSSGAENETDVELNARQRRRIKRAHRRGTTLKRYVDDAVPPDLEEPSTFIGPLLPITARSSPGLEPSSVTSGLPDLVARQHSLSPNVEFPNTQGDASLVSDEDMEHSDEQSVMDVDNRAIEDSVHKLFDQFGTLNVTLSDVSRLHMLFVQLSTRFEDWQSGALSRDYFLRKISQLETQLTHIVGQGLPVSWTFSWDNSKKKYFYTDLATGRIAWQPPIVCSQSHQSVRFKVRDTAEQSKTISETKENATAAAPISPLVPSYCHSPKNKPPEILVNNNPLRSNVFHQTNEVAVTAETRPSLKSSAVRTQDIKVDRTEHLQAQLREFEEVCREFEELEASIPTVLGETGDVASANMPDGFPLSEIGKLEKSKSREKRAKVSSSDTLAGNKALPNLIRKWQQLQESL